MRTTPGPETQTPQPARAYPADMEIARALPAAVLAARDRLVAAAADGTLDRLAARFGIDILTLHGSAARTGVDDPHDLDIAVRFSDDSPDILGFMVAIKDLAELDEVDVLDLDHCSVLARARALGPDTIPLYESRSGLWARAQMGALSLELEDRPRRRLALEMLAGR